MFVVVLAVESVRMVLESDIGVIVLSVCMLCVGVGATAPVPS